MDQKIESQIISAFIIDLKKERAKYELWNEKKRRDFIWKTCVRKYFNERCVRRITQPISSWQDVYRLLKKNGAPDACYVLSINEGFDGVTLPLEVALEHLVFNGPALISCIHGKLAYLGEEPTIGPSAKYLLIREQVI